MSELAFDVGLGAEDAAIDEVADAVAQELISGWGDGGGF